MLPMLGTRSPAQLLCYVISSHIGLITCSAHVDRIARVCLVLPYWTTVETTSCWRTSVSSFFACVGPMPVSEMVLPWAPRLSLKWSFPVFFTMWSLFAVGGSLRTCLLPRGQKQMWNHSRRLYNTFAKFQSSQLPKLFFTHCCYE